MGKLERITFTVPEEMAAKLRAAVDSGGYATTSEVVREALRDWGDQQDRREASDAAIRAMVEEARRSESLPAEQVFAEVRAHVAKIVAEERARRKA